jgi:beta-glucosidase
VTVEVINSGELAGDEVVQLYVHQQGATSSRPIQELKGFCRITLQPGERKRVTFGLHTHQLGTYEDGTAYTVQPGKWDVMLGPSSRDIRLGGEFEIVGKESAIGADKVFFSQVEVTPSN